MENIFGSSPHYTPLQDCSSWPWRVGGATYSNLPGTCEHLIGKARPCRPLSFCEGLGGSYEDSLDYRTGNKGRSPQGTHTAQTATLPLSPALEISVVFVTHSQLILSDEVSMDFSRLPQNPLVHTFFLIGIYMLSTKFLF